MQSDDRKLAERAAAGDAGSFNRLMEKHERRMYAVALRICRNKEDAEDCLQEAMLRIYRAFFVNRSSFAETLHGYIATHLRERLSVARLAQVAHLSPSHFAYRFRKEMGMTPQAYVENQRLNFALRLIATNGGNIKDAAFTAGFPNPLYFSKRFRKAFGFPPSKLP